MNRQVNYCSFCGKADYEVKTLLAAPVNALICDECVDTAVAVIAAIRLDSSDPYIWRDPFGQQPKL
jgi:ATP-dependent protease Clp ATPase subunit